MEPENEGFPIGISSSRASFSGSILVFGGCKFYNEVTEININIQANPSWGKRCFLSISFWVSSLTFHRGAHCLIRGFIPSFTTTYLAGVKYRVYWALGWKITFLVIQNDLFGMVKWPFQAVKWPPTRGWKGHFESPGPLLGGSSQSLSS